MVLVTGASGKTGKAVLKALVEKNQRVRALAFRDEHTAGLSFLGAAEVMVGDMLDPGFAQKATHSVRAVYHICPNVHPAEVEIADIMIAAARLNGCGHFVYHSVLHPQTEAMPHHWLKLRVEEGLLGSGLPFTILQPAPYMQNVRAYWKSISKQGVYPVPYAAETIISMVDLEDVAQVAARVLTEPTHKGAVYPLCGSETLSQTDVAQQIENVIGRQVGVKVVSRRKWRKSALESGLNAYQVETLVKMFAYYEQHHFKGNANILRWMLNREPTTFVDFLKRMVHEASDI